MEWNARTIARAKALLRQHAFFEPVLAQLNVTRTALRKAFARHGLAPPQTFLRKLVLPGAPIPEPPVAYGVASEVPRRILVDGDTHYPDHDPRIEAVKFAFAQDFKPDLWISVGDTFDFYSLSSYTKEPDKLGSFLQAEFDAARDYTAERERVAKENVYLLGNHENRLYKMICANPGLFGLRALEFRHLAGLPESAKVLPYGAAYKTGPITFAHGDDFGGRFGVKNPAAWYLANRGARNIVFGHYHRFESVSRTVWDEHGEPHTYLVQAQGHGQDTAKATYIREPSWQHGFTAVELWKQEGKIRFTLFPIQVIGGQFSWGGKVYK